MATIAMSPVAAMVFRLTGARGRAHATQVADVTGHNSVNALEQSMGDKQGVASVIAICMCSVNAMYHVSHTSSYLKSFCASAVAWKCHRVYEVIEGTM